MDESCDVDMLQINTVTKAEPPDIKIILCAEYVENIPMTNPLQALSRLCNQNRDSLQEGMTEDNPFKLKHLRIVLKDDWGKIENLKTEFKAEPEENIYDVSLQSAEPFQEAKNVQPAEKESQYQDNRKLPNKKKATLWIPQVSSVSPKGKILLTRKKAKVVSYKNKNTSSSDSSSDSDETYTPDVSYTPKRPTRQSASQLIKKQKNPSPLRKGMPGTYKIRKTIRAGENGVSWSCCYINFEDFSSFNKHKTQDHQVDEFRCPLCPVLSFPSLDEIEKHYVDHHTDSTGISFYCLECKLVFGVKSSFHKHKVKCSECQVFSSGLNDSKLDNDVTKKKVENGKVSGDKNTVFKLSCCGNIFEKFEDFNVHKVSDHNISLLTCGLCYCAKISEGKLRLHYKNGHFSKNWKENDLAKGSNVEEASESTRGSISEDTEEKSIQEVGVHGECTVLQNGILCPCAGCKKTIEATHSSTEEADLNTRSPFYCTLCSRGFKSKRNLELHISRHDGIKTVPCNICGIGFITENELQTHNKYQHSSNRIQVTCTICNKHFTRKTILKRHIQNVHNNKNKTLRLKCKYCEKTFGQEDNLRRHLQQCHLKEQEFICGHCNAVFYHKHNLVAHMKCRHLPKEKHSCPICGSVRDSESKLKTHMNDVHSSRRFSCDVCGSMFKTKQNVLLHRVKHSDAKPFVCHDCGKSFKRRLNLEQHLYTHSNNKPHKCMICGKSFKLRTHIKQHMAVHGFIKSRKC